MRTVHLPSLTLVTAAALTLTGTTVAQEQPSGLLSNLEVTQLIERAEPADHARLSAHFAALADRYTAEARRHTSMSRSFAGNPNRNVGGGMSTHCRRLAELNTQSAETVRELVTYHKALASGTAATPPRDGAKFEAGAGAPEPTEADLAALAAKAGTPAEHHALEEYFLTLSKRYTAEAAQHETLARTYRGTRIPQVGAHHERLARLAQDGAKEAREAAELHKTFATLPR